MGTINFNKFLLILKHLKFTKYLSETEMSEKNRAKRRRKNKVAFNFVYGFYPKNIIVCIFDNKFVLGFCLMDIFIKSRLVYQNQNLKMSNCQNQSIQFCLWILP